MEKLSSTLKQLLNSANISEAELARRTGIAQPMVNRLATGKNKNPKLETLKPIAKYFSVTFSQLLGEEELPNNNSTNITNLTSSATTYQLPVLSWAEVAENILNSEKMIATTARVSERAFALLVEDNSLEPRFPVNSLLTIDPEVNYNNDDFVLVKNTATQAIELQQVTQSEGRTILTKLTGDKDSKAFDPEQHVLLGVLVQAKHVYK